MPTLDLLITAGADDVRHQDDPDSINTTTNDLSTGVWVGAATITYGSALLFKNATIPPGSIITAAWFGGYSKTSESGTIVRTNVFAESDSNPSQVTSDAEWHTLVSSGLTTTFTAWDNIPSWTADQYYQSLSLVDVIQEVIELPGWASGNAINIIWLDDGSNDNAVRRFLSWDSWFGGSGAEQPKLHIEYTESTPPSSGFTPSSGFPSSGFPSSGFTPSEFIAPEFVSITPPLTSRIPVGSDFVIVYDDAFDPSTVTTQNIIFEDSDNNPVDFSVSLSSDGTTITINPTSNLSNDKVYSITLTSNMRGAP